MDSLNIKEKLSRIRFFIDKIKYRREKHFYIAVSGLLLLMVVFFTVVFINQRLEIKRKENILKSYYPENHSDSTELESVDGNTGEIKISSGEEGIFKSDKNMVSTGDPDGQLPAGGTIRTYICGEVKNPGVYDIENGARVIDLLKLAGGQNEDACLDIVNLAEIVFDGQRIYIPSLEEINSSGFYLSGSDYSYNSSYLEMRIVNINTAGLKELESLPGIGPVTAGNIIEYRNKKGLFKAREELKNVTGIGQKKYEKIKQYISV